MWYAPAGSALEKLPPRSGRAWSEGTVAEIEGKLRIRLTRYAEAGDMLRRSRPIRSFNGRAGGSPLRRAAGDESGERRERSPEKGQPTIEREDCILSRRNYDWRAGGLAFPIDTNPPMAEAFRPTIPCQRANVSPTARDPANIAAIGTSPPSL